MHLLSASETRSRLSGIVHYSTQASSKSGLDLTADTVSTFTAPGQLDFGGDEARPAEHEVLPPQKEDSDDYGWWALDAGSYLVRFNESVELNRGQIALVAPHERLLATGAHHPVFWLRAPREIEDLLEVVIAVGRPGVRIKENARLSTLLFFDDGSL